jgi:hypothetical protein
VKRDWVNWPRRFIRWLFGGPFRKLPPAFGSTVPADLQVFEAQAEEAEHHGVGGVATQAPTPHPKTRPARPDSSLERQ